MDPRHNPVATRTVSPQELPPNPAVTAPLVPGPIQTDPASDVRGDSAAPISRYRARYAVARPRTLDGRHPRLDQESDRGGEGNAHVRTAAGGRGRALARGKRRAARTTCSSSTSRWRRRSTSARRCSTRMPPATAARRSSNSRPSPRAFRRRRRSIRSRRWCARCSSRSSSNGSTSICRNMVDEHVKREITRITGRPL